MSLKTSINRLGAVAVMALSVLALVTPTASPAGATHGNRAFIYALWNDFVGDDPDSATLAYWENRLDNALSTRSQVVNSLLTSASFQDDYIYQVYQLYTDRYPDDTQYAAATTATSGGDFVEVELAVLSGAEYSDDDAVADVDYVAKVFNDVLHRSPGAGESSYWTGQLAVWTRKTVARHIVRSSESAENRVEGLVPSPCAATQLTSFSDVTAGSYCLILKRSASAGDTSYWAPTLTTSTGQITTLWRQLASSLEYYNTAAIRFPSV